MKPATLRETRMIVKAWISGNLKRWLAGKAITYHCAMMRISRFRREYPKEYKGMAKC